MRHCYALATPEFPDESTVFGLSCDYHDYEGFEDNVQRIAEAGYDGAFSHESVGMDEDVDRAMDYMSPIF